jgi:hypothetical protein
MHAGERDGGKKGKKKQNEGGMTSPFAFFKAVFPFLVVSPVLAEWSL